MVGRYHDIVDKSQKLCFKAADSKRRRSQQLHGGFGVTLRLVRDRVLWSIASSDIHTHQ